MARYLTLSDESFLDSLEFIYNSQDRSKAILYDLSVYAQHPSARSPSHTKKLAVWNPT